MSKRHAKKSPSFKPSPQPIKQKVNVIVVQSDATQLIYALPAIKKLSAKVDMALVIVQPRNPELSIDLCKKYVGLTPTVVSPEHAQSLLNQSYVEQLAKQGTQTLLLHYGMEIQQGMRMGMPAHQCFLSRIGIQDPTPIYDALKTKVNVFKSNYVVVAPEPEYYFDPNMQMGKKWSKWHEFLAEVSKTTEIIVLHQPNEEKLLPVGKGIIDNVSVVESANLEVILETLKRARKVYATDNVFSVLASAVNTPLVQLYAGTPVTWTAMIKDGNKVITSIDINSITLEKVLES